MKIQPLRVKLELIRVRSYEILQNIENKKENTERVQIKKQLGVLHD